jgi:hypothetical protein
MKCSGSQTICTAAEPRRERAAVERSLQGLLFTELLAPLRAALGPTGDIVVGAVTRRLFPLEVRDERP